MSTDHEAADDVASLERLPVRLALGVADRLARAAVGERGLPLAGAHVHLRALRPSHPHRVLLVDGGQVTRVVALPYLKVVCPV